jgi:hypothetical protein
MRLPDEEHFSRPWRIHEVAPDFRLEDVWALPTPGAREDFVPFVEHFATADDAREHGLRAELSRALFALRWKLGEWFGWDDRPPAATLLDHLPADLLHGPRGPELANVPFRSLYLTEDEWAAEIVNRTVHGVLHMGWVPDGDGYRGQMAVLVKPNGRFGAAYMRAIAPFRYAIVYPALIAGIGRRWERAKVAPMDHQTA